MPEKNGDTRDGHRAGSGANEPKRHEKKEQAPDWRPRQGGDQTRSDPEKQRELEEQREATLRPGAVVRVFVTRPGTNTFGKYAKFTVRRSTAPKRTDCRVVPRKKKPSNCKTS